MSRDFAKPRDQSVIWLCCLEPLKISQHFTKFSGHRHCGSRDKTVVWLYGYEPIKAGCQHVKFGGYSYSGIRVIMVLACHLISQDHLIKRPRYFMGGSPSWKVTTLPSLVAMSIVVVEIWRLLWLKSKIPYALAKIHYYCLSLKHIACHAHTYKMSGHRHNNLSVCPKKDSWSWSHMSTKATDGTYLTNICQSFQKQRWE